MTHNTNTALQALSGLRVLDLTRILAGPTCTQLLGDLGADVIKVERPGHGDDTRGWGPPFLKDQNGNDTDESAYFLSANRSKKSIAIDLSQPDGQKIISDIAKQSDVLVENFRVGQLARYNLDYETLKQQNEKLIYCSITGFGQTGPLKYRPGYDFMAQGIGGIMSLTGFPDAQEGEPTKVGVGITDVVCGMYACTAILSALHHRHQTGQGQYIDMALYDSQLAWLINQGVGYLISGEVPPRRGNEHPTIVPYGTFPASDKTFIIAVGNDTQFARLCQVLGAPKIAQDLRFKHNVDRVRNRSELLPLLNDLTAKQTAEYWLTQLEDNHIPCGPINNLQDAFDNPQAQHRNMSITLQHPLGQNNEVSLIGNPIQLSQTPVSYKLPPPLRGEHTREVLQDILRISESDIRMLEQDGIIEDYHVSKSK
ncbi:MAG: CaiB/BaiF CoA-transferase family protein [Pseudomonadota bacterium]